MNIYARPRWGNKQGFAGPSSHHHFSGGAVSPFPGAVRGKTLRLGCPKNGATGREESIANRTSIGILSVSVWWSSRRIAHSAKNKFNYMNSFPSIYVSV